MSNCKYCQHEVGHSQSCPKYIPVDFDDLFPGLKDKGEPEFVKEMKRLNKKIQNE